MRQTRDGMRTVTDLLETSDGAHQPLGLGLGEDTNPLLGLQAQSSEALAKVRRRLIALKK